ncbi:MAG: peptide-methionine (S)-S-oxide reductase MsrA [Cytophagaceae bacterium]|jgi:peptide-methionine (S)-S-oxide reductase|nr:peptide-methionine (S)-S-oxide reductase MsrA [Cytophagaceae bacterium]
MKPEPIVSETSATLDSATFGNGCFWCTEAVFQQLKGVDTVVSGYSGGKLKNPTYKEVCSGLSGHAEVLRIYFNPKVIDFTTLLEVFWNTHDPTTPNRQGNDVGTQYRSVVFYHNDQQRILAEAYKKQLDSSGVFKAPIVTEISPLINFYAAEDYHQNYFNENGSQPYCQIIIRPKVEKFKKSYSTLLKQP